MSRPQFDPAGYAAQLAEKTERLKACWRPSTHRNRRCSTPREHYRLRAEFRLWRETGGETRHYAMFEAGDKFTPVLIEDFPSPAAASTS